MDPRLWLPPAALLLVVMTCGLGGCAPRQKNDLQASSPDPVSTSVVDYQFLVDEAASDGALPENWEIDPPRIIQSPLPVYPEVALAAGDSNSTVAVQFRVRTDGSVGDIDETPLASSTAAGSAEAFRASVDAALLEWEFSPGLMRVFEPGPDHDGDGESDYRIQKHTIPVSILYHVRFHFRLVDGVGQVELESAAPQ